jgi:hypothetical protein
MLDHWDQKWTLSDMDKQQEEAQAGVSDTNVNKDRHK